MKLMLAKTGTEKDLDNPMMAAELKADGTHIRLDKKEKARIFGRPKKSGTPEYTDRLPELIEAAQAIPGEFTLIGEAVVYDENGRTWFEGSQRRCSTEDPAKIPLKAAKYPVLMLTFDIIELDGKDLRSHTYLSRKDILFDLLEETTQKDIVPLPHVVENKRDFYQELVDRGEEGVILKRINSTYQHDRSKDWLKIKKWDVERLLVVGWTPGEGRRADQFGALILAKQDDNGRLVFRGKVGSGFNDGELKHIFKLLKQHEVEKKAVITDEEFTPVDIPLEVTVKFFEETKNNILRMPSMMKDKQGNNLIHYESTITGLPQIGAKQTSLSALFASMKKKE